MDNLSSQSPRLQPNSPQRKAEILEFREWAMEQYNQKRISRTGLRLCFIILNFTSKGRPCFIGNARFAEKFGVKPKTIVNVIGDLVRAGFVNRFRVNGRRQLEVLGVSLRKNRSATKFKQKRNSHFGGSVTNSQDQGIEWRKTNTKDTVPAPLRGDVDNVTDANPVGLEPVPSAVVPMVTDPPDIPPAASPPPESPVDMFPGLPPAKGPQPSPVGLERAKRLKGALNAAKRNVGYSKLNKWAAEFDILGRAVKDEDRIDAVLLWYCAHIGKPWVPVALCAEAFRKKFVKIEMAQERMNRNAAVVPPTKDDPDADQIIERLSRKSWSRTTPEQVAAAVRASVRNLKNFLEKLESAKLSADAEAVRDRIRVKMGTAAWEVEQWFRALHEWVPRATRWNGKFDNHLWHPGHEKFKTQVTHWCGHAGLEDSVWDEILTVVSRS